jgi:transcriptional regulator GlxA family with amidase domain
MKPVHISEICGSLNVSRRTLHRAFHEAIGMGPIAFLQRRRLCSVHSALRQSNPATTTIAEIAMQHGFLNLGRFSGYYRALFDEYPSETFGKAHPGPSRSFPRKTAAISTAASPASRWTSSPH